jgi:uncharacterized protein with von Willebrand factor type A (vWA) domain
MKAHDPRLQLAAFAHYLRGHGYALGYAEVELMARAAAALPLDQWPRLQGLWRAIACGDQRQWQQYPTLHQAFWFAHRLRGSARSIGLPHKGRSLPEVVQQLHAELQRPPSEPRASASDPPVLGLCNDEVGPLAESGTDRQRAQGGASRAAAMHQQDFSAWGPDQLDRLEPLLEQMQRRLRKQLQRRLQQGASYGLLQLRRCLRAALSCGGELAQLRYARRLRRPPRVTVAVDVSRSMETHAHFFLRLARAFADVMDARTFVFHTHVSEVTPLMKRRSPRLHARIQAMTLDLGGGTRIASSLHALLHEHLGRALRRGDLLLVLSDGYDTDESHRLAEVLSRARGRGARIGWLHPTATVPQSAAIEHAAPQITRFLPIHNLSSLTRLPELLD